MKEKLKRRGYIPPHSFYLFINFFLYEFRNKFTTNYIIEVFDQKKKNNIKFVYTHHYGGD